MNIFKKIAGLFKGPENELEQNESPADTTLVADTHDKHDASAEDIKSSIAEIKAAIDNLRSSIEEIRILSVKKNEIELHEPSPIKTVTEMSEERQSSDGIDISENIIGEICNKIVAWEEQRETLVTLSQNDLLKFVIAECKQILDLAGVPTISEENNFKFSRHEALGLKGRIPRPGDLISQTVEDGYELNGKVLLKAKVTLK